MSKDDNLRYIRLSTACRTYDTPRSNWYRAFERGELTRYKRGSSVYLEVSQIEAWITGASDTAA